MNYPTPLRRGALAPPQLGGPLYFQIQQLIRERILSKEWAKGHPLPNETDLASSYGVSLGTMRKALDLLTQSKLIIRRQGLGTFINSLHQEPPSRYRRWTSGGELAAETEHLVLEKSFGQPLAEDAQLLRLSVNMPVARVTVKTSVSGVFVAVDEFIIPVALAPGLDDFMTGSGADFDQHLNQLEAGIVRCEDRLRPEIATAHVARVLDIDGTAAILRIDRLAFGRDSHPLFICHRYIAAKNAADYQVVIE